MRISKEQRDILLAAVEEAVVVGEKGRKQRKLGIAMERLAKAGQSAEDFKLAREKIDKAEKAGTGVTLEVFEVKALDTVLDVQGKTFRGIRRWIRKLRR